MKCALFAGRSWTGDGRGRCVKTSPASEIHVERFTAEEIEVRKVHSFQMFLCTNGFLRQEDLPDRSQPPAASIAEGNFREDDRE